HRSRIRRGAPAHDGTGPRPGRRPGVRRRARHRTPATRVRGTRARPVPADARSATRDRHRCPAGGRATRRRTDTRPHARAADAAERGPHPPSVERASLLAGRFARHRYRRVPPPPAGLRDAGPRPVLVQQPTHRARRAVQLVGDLPVCGPTGSQRRRTLPTRRRPALVILTGLGTPPLNRSGGTAYPLRRLAGCERSTGLVHAGAWIECAHSPNTSARSVSRSPRRLALTTAAPLRPCAACHSVLLLKLRRTHRLMLEAVACTSENGRGPPSVSSNVVLTAWQCCTTMRCHSSIGIAGSCRP